MLAAEVRGIFLRTDIILVHIFYKRGEIAHIACLVLIDIAFIRTEAEIFNTVEALGYKQPYSESGKERHFV